MVYGLSTDGFKHLTNYAAAKQHHDNTKPIRGRLEEVRPLRSNRKDNTTIRMDGDDVVLRLYQTDMIRFHPDDSITVGGYATKSSAEFVGGVLPMVRASFTDDYTPFILWVFQGSNGKVSYDLVPGYLYGNEITLRREGQGYTVNPKQLTTIRVPSVDRKASAQLRREVGYAEFCKWQDTIHRLDPELHRKHRWPVEHGSVGGDMVDFWLRKGAEGYQTLINRLTWDCRDQILQRLYAHNGGFQYEAINTFIGFDHYRRSRALLKKYG